MGIGLAFAAYLALAALTALIALRLPAPRALENEPFFVSLRGLAANARWQGFLVTVFLVGTAYAILNNYLVLYLTELGAGEGLFGLSVAAAGVSELPVFILSPLLFRRWKPQSVLIISFVAFILRGIAYSFIVDPRWAVGAQLLHGLSFSALWAAGVTYAGNIAPPGLGASAQSAFGATLFGLSGTIGALVGGRLYAAIGPVLMFQVAAGMALLGLLVFGLTESRTQSYAPADV
jgi:PPP family 3-phenylpropionic acid transporter